MFQWILEHQDAATLLFTAVVALSTIVYAALTALLVFETRRMRRAQTDPKLAVFFEPIEEFVNFGHLYVQNIGLGPAYDVSFKLEPEGSISGAQQLINDFSSTKFLERGVKYLGPGQKLRSGYTAFTEGYEEKIKAILVVRLCYRSSTNRKHEDEYRVDFSELEGAGRLGKPHLYSIAQSLEKIQRDIGHLSTGFEKLKVNVYDREDREEERAAREKQIGQMKEAKKKSDA